SVEEPGSQRLGQGWGYGVADDDLNLGVGQLIARLDPLVDELEIIREALDTRSLVGGQTSGNTRVDKTPASHRREATGNGLRRTVPPQTAVHCGVIMFALVTLGALFVRQIVHVIIEEILHTPLIVCVGHGSFIEK